MSYRVQHVWLVERGPTDATEYLTLENGLWHWQQDPSDAFRCARQKDAAALEALIFQFGEATRVAAFAFLLDDDPDGGAV
ncbi:hypothetical protein ACVDG3_06925 [Meridianimarinicoccus sp. RP-17]|uniref:hypothetical protein n=1 Tax=Meridianimarinicoccus zhengii TaxID=2056810 RepID=UPI0013A6EB17|nr:hypothetical protein [Phycocomes zhengii]